MKKYYLDFLKSTNRTALTLLTHEACKNPHKKNNLRKRAIEPLTYYKLLFLIMLFSTPLKRVVHSWNVLATTCWAHGIIPIVLAMGSDIYFTVGTLTFGTFWQHNTRRIGLHFLNSGGSWRVQSWYPWLSTPLEYFLALMGQHTTMPSLYIDCYHWENTVPQYFYFMIKPGFKFKTSF